MPSPVPANALPRKSPWRLHVYPVVTPLRTIVEERARLSGTITFQFFGVEDEKFGSVRSLQLGILGSSLLQDRNVGVGGFP
jgi:hypothetical protein